jgi:tetratricopeptide (TPR) repeat protein
MQAVGHYDVAERLLDGVSQSSEDPTLIGSLAVLRAEQGHVSLAESLFDRAIQTLRGTSPFPLAQLVFRRGLMWMRVNEAGPARDWFSEATRLLPAYAPAVGHLAELDLAEGRPADAVEKLHSVARTSDDPEYAACLSEALSAAGDEDAAAAWRERAVARYEELEARHPEAFVDHAAAFWLGPGRDPIRGRALSLRALVTNHTDRSRDRALRALSFAGSAWPTPGASVV